MNSRPAAAREGLIVYLGQRAAVAGLTSRDRWEIERWITDQCTALIANAVFYHGDHGAYAMLYEGSKPWASWGVTRQGGDLLVWDCVTFADIGRFLSTRDALAGITSGTFTPMAPLANVIAFRGSKRSEWARG